MRNRQKRDEMRDRAVGIASCEGALKGDGNEREMMARVAKSTSGSSSHAGNAPGPGQIPKAVKCAGQCHCVTRINPLGDTQTIYTGTFHGSRFYNHPRHDPASAQKRPPIIDDQTKVQL